VYRSDTPASDRTGPSALPIHHKKRIINILRNIYSINKTKYPTL